MKLRQVFVSAVLCLSLSCTVFEDRNACGCRLVLNLSEAVETLHPEDALRLVLSGPDGFHSEEILLREDIVEPYRRIYEVPKGICRVTACSGDTDIPEGEDCPRIYMFSESVGTDAEIVEREVILHKSFCVLTLQMKDTEGSVSHLSLTVSGNVDGYTQDGYPRDGRFSRTVAPGEDGAAVRLPRQKDNSLLLSISLDGESLVNFAIGEYIAASGYDWSAPDLEDITVEIDFACTVMTLKVDEWSVTVPMYIRM